MAEILLRVIDKVNTTSVYLDTKCLKRGDVVVVCPDNHPWGARELTNPDWRILKLPNITVTQLASFLAEEPETNPDMPSRTRLCRWYRFNIDATTGQLRLYLNDVTRTQPFFTSQFSFAQVDALRVQKTSVPDPERF